MDKEDNYTIRILAREFFICYNGFMKNRYSKVYFEKYAALTLHQYFNIKEDEILQSDRPDLRIPILNMGIEVTQAIKDDFVFSLKKESLYSSYVMNPFDLKEMLKIHEDDMESYYDCIDRAIQRKIEKSKNYEAYQINGLYIFTHCNQLNKQMIQAFFLQHHYDNSFYRYIYLNGITQLFIYDCLNDHIEIFDYALEDLIAYNQISLLYEENEYKKRIKEKDESNGK